MEARDNTHLDFIKRWAKKIREDKTGKWRCEHANFINSQYDNAYRVIEILKKKEGGKEKLRRIYKINNKKGFPDFY